MSILSEPRKPDCDVCDWATAYHYSFGMNLCAADLAIVEKISQAERERIIKLLEEQIATCEENNLDEHGCRQFDWETYWDVRITEFKVAIALIKGDDK